MSEELSDSNSKSIHIQDWTNKVISELKGKTPNSLYRTLLDGRIQKILYTKETYGKQLVQTNPINNNTDQFLMTMA